MEIHSPEPVAKRPHRIDHCLRDIQSREYLLAPRIYEEVGLIIIDGLLYEGYAVIELRHRCPVGVKLLDTSVKIQQRIYILAIDLLLIVYSHSHSGVKTRRVRRVFRLPFRPIQAVTVNGPE